MNPVQSDDDDRPVGRLLTRREILTLAGSVAGGVLVAACLPGSAPAVA